MAEERLVVDGMNVIGARPDGWWRDRDGAVRRLHARLRGLGGSVVLVLDGRPLPDLPEGVHGGVTVRYGRRGGPDAADDRIVELVSEDPGVTVVTSDRRLRERVRALEAEVRGAGAFLRGLGEGRGAVRDEDGPMPQHDSDPDAPAPLEGGQPPGAAEGTPGSAVTGEAGRVPDGPVAGEAGRVPGAPGDADPAGDADVGGGAPGTDEDPLRTHTAGGRGAEAPRD